MAFSLKYNLILGSKSPRRKELLEKLGFEFTQISLDADETFPADLPPQEVAEFLSRKKAAAGIDDLNADDLLITSDTTVVIGKTILNKAANAAEAKAMLELLSGKEHEVISGVCLTSKEKAISFSVSTKVFFKELSADEIDYYIEKYKPFDKAGAYGIQEWIGMIGVEKMEGSFYNVMGLPVKEVWEQLRSF
ncbi:MAG: septum formation protein Maf [Flavobacteriales bacterium]|mgnify:CR=1 FL=1|nr:septum formation protein Maf [Flavobacteriales bacterium]